MYTTQVIDIEIIEPAKVKIPGNYKNIATRYNNYNIAPNPYFSKSYQNNTIVTDSTNLDSIASKIYYEYFVDELSNQNFFDTITQVEAFDYSSITVIDTFKYDITFISDSLFANKEHSPELNVYLFSKHIHTFPVKKNDSTSRRYLHPKLALYRADELQNIADSTNAHLLISLDYFSSIDGVFFDRKIASKKEFVITSAYWNFYDLRKQEFLFSYNRADTIFWEDNASEYGLRKILPPQKDAVLNAADMSGSGFAQFLVPHWIEVQRMYYTSGHIELKKTKQLVEEGKWKEATEIWKANTKNPNKSIAAKCKFNMGLACEMQGSIDAALEWVVESFYVFGEKNMVHFTNCTEYIRILSQRKLDKKLLDKQYNLVD